MLIGLFTTSPTLGGTYGLINLPKVQLFGWTLERSIDWCIPLLVAVAVVWFLCWRIGESPYGRVLKGIREDERAVLSLGKNVFRAKVVVFGITSAMAGFAGALLSGFLQLATPGLFGFSISLTIFAMVVVGGMANLLGSVIGALLLSSLEPILTLIHRHRSAEGLLRRAHRLRRVARALHRPATSRPGARRSVAAGLARGRWALSGRIEMLRAEGWTPAVGEAVQRLAQAEQEYLETAVPVVSSPSAEDDGAVDRWAQAPITLEVKELTKRFGGIVAADESSMTLRQG